MSQIDLNGENDTLEQIVINDSLRYKRKGWGLLVAILITLLFFSLGPILGIQIMIISLGKQVWPVFMDWAGYVGDDTDKAARFRLYLIIAYWGHNLIFWGWNIVHLFIYKLKSPFFESYKINPDKPWPWDEDYEKWQKTIRKASINVVCMNVFFTFMLICFDNYVLDALKMRMDYQSFPTHLEVLKQVTFFMFCEDFFFYWAHRTLHHKSIYQYIHKQHHEFKEPVSITSEYAHPAEVFLANLLPTVSGIKLLGPKCHLFTVLMWYALRIAETIDGHSGYEFSWSPFRLLPFSGSATYHNYHHTHNVGNYSSFFTFWDTFCKTNKNYFKYLNGIEQQKESKKKQ